MRALNAPAACSRLYLEMRTGIMTGIDVEHRTELEKAFKTCRGVFKLGRGRDDEGEEYADLFSKGNEWAIGVIMWRGSQWLMVLRSGAERTFRTAAEIVPWLLSERAREASA